MTMDAGQLAACLKEAMDQIAAFGESVVYYPSSGTGRTIEGIVTRSGPMELQGFPAGRSELLQVSVANDAVSGISSAEIDTGTDFIEVAARLGDTAKKRRVLRIVSQDYGMMTLEVQG
jgi:hypothetical protein